MEGAFQSEEPYGNELPQGLAAYMTAGFYHMIVPQHCNVLACCFSSGQFTESHDGFFLPSSLDVMHRLENAHGHYSLRAVMSSSFKWISKLHVT